MRIDEYFRHIDETLALCSRVSLKTLLYDERSETKGFIKGILHFDDGSELHLREFVDVSAGVDRYKYSYHYSRRETLIFRYDNSADIVARELPTYPHHKHVGDTLQASTAPTLQMVLEEILRAPIIAAKVYKNQEANLPFRLTRGCPLFALWAGDGEECYRSSPKEAP